MFSRAVIGAVLVGAALGRASAEQPLDLQMLSREVSQLRDAVDREATLAQWRGAHRAARIEPAPFGEWCVEASYTPEWTRDELPIEVVARFYPPATPASLELPAAASRLTDACRLLHFTVRLPGDASRTTAAADLSRAITQRLGAAVVPTGWTGAPPVAFWTTPAATIALTEIRHDISVIGVRRGAGIGIRTGRADIDSQRDAWRVALAPRIARLEEAVMLAGANDAPVRRLLERIAASPSQMPGSEADLVAAMESLLAGQPPDAARYLAAELILVFAQNAGVANMTQAAPQATALRRRLERLGARFVFAELGRAYLYDHGFLTRASKMRSSERVDELVFITYQDIGFETSFACGDQRGAGFRAVITRGRKFLADHPETKVAGAIYLNLSRAYGDAVEVEGVVPELFNAAEARVARTRAVDAYLESIRRDGVTPAATALWSDMWRLRAGLAPKTSHFVCHYD
jgi:hypothetical protein